MEKSLVVIRRKKVYLWANEKDLSHLRTLHKLVTTLLLMLSVRREHLARHSGPQTDKDSDCQSVEKDPLIFLAIPWTEMTPGE